MHVLARQRRDRGLHVRGHEGGRDGLRGRVPGFPEERPRRPGLRAELLEEPRQRDLEQPLLAHAGPVPRGLAVRRQHRGGVPGLRRDHGARRLDPFALAGVDVLARRLQVAEHVLDARGPDAAPRAVPEQQLHRGAGLLGTPPPRLAEGEGQRGVPIAGRDDRQAQGRLLVVAGAERHLAEPTAELGRRRLLVVLRQQRHRLLPPCRSGRGSRRGSGRTRGRPVRRPPSPRTSGPSRRRPRRSPRRGAGHAPARSCNPGRSCSARVSSAKASALRERPEAIMRSPLITSAVSFAGSTSSTSSRMPSAWSSSSFARCSRAIMSRSALSFGFFSRAARRCPMRASDSSASRKRSMSKVVEAGCFASALARIFSQRVDLLLLQPPPDADVEVPEVHAVRVLGLGLADLAVRLLEVALGEVATWPCRTPCGPRPGRRPRRRSVARPGALRRRARGRGEGRYEPWRTSWGGSLPRTDCDARPAPLGTSASVLRLSRASMRACLNPAHDIVWRPTEEQIARTRVKALMDEVGVDDLRGPPPLVRRGRRPLLGPGPQAPRRHLGRALRAGAGPLATASPGRGGSWEGGPTSSSTAWTGTWRRGAATRRPSSARGTTARSAA